MSDVARNAPELLRQQIEELGSLRNASTRDPQFKQWRQNTLTVIQRIWPGQAPRSERFRRVPFSPPSSKHDARTAREHFERGCGEALEYLNLLLRLIEEQGAPTASSPESVGGGAPGAFEDDYPVIQLPGDSTATPATPNPEASAPHVGPARLGSSAASQRTPPGASAPRSDDEAPRSSEPANPTEAPTGPPPIPRPAARSTGPAPSPRVSVRAERPRDPAAPAGEPVNPLSDILSSMNAPPVTPSATPPAERPGRSGRGRKGGGKQRLKEMLGLSEMGRDPHSSPRSPVNPPEAARESAPSVTPIEERREAPARQAARGEESGPDALTLPEFMVPAETPPPLTSADVETPLAPEEAAPRSRDEHAPPASEEVGPTGRDESAPHAREEIAPTARQEAAPTAREFDFAADAEASFEPVELPEGGEADDAARVTAEFVMKSPVLSSQARPVQRRNLAATPQSEAPLAPSPAATELMRLASEVASLGVSDGQRAVARAMLLDLARLIQTNEMSWDSLRDAVQFLMQFPPLARRALPVLLPYLDLAA